MFFDSSKPDCGAYINITITIFSPSVIFEIMILSFTLITSKTSFAHFLATPPGTFSLLDQSSTNLTFLTIYIGINLFFIWCIWSVLIIVIFPHQTQILNKHLNELMDGLTAKVFRTYNASRTLQEQLELLTDPDAPISAKILQYNRANRAVAVLCNHQRAAPKSFDKSMANLQKKINDKREQVEEAERECKQLKKLAKSGGSQKEKINHEKKKKALERLSEQLEKLEHSATDKEENKTIALGTSKLNYLDPRISVAWCKKYNVPIEKVYNKTQRQKFQWAIDMATGEYNFLGEPMNITKNSSDGEGDDDNYE